jgi:hypothetical protein
MSKKKRDEEMTLKELLADPQTRQAMMEWVLSEGLERSATNELEFAHPDDKDLTACCDPWTQEVLMSRKLCHRFFASLGIDSSPQ